MKLSHVLERFNSNNNNLIWSMPDDNNGLQFTVIVLTKCNYFVYIEVEKDDYNLTDLPYEVKTIYTNLLHYKLTEIVRPKELFNLLEQLEKML